MAHIVMVMESLAVLLSIGPARANKLRDSGVDDAFQLLRLCGTPRSRRRFHDGTGLGPDQLLDWALTVDLLRLPGMDGPRARLLRRAGVDGIVALRHCRAGHVTRRLRELLPQGPPIPVERVRGWIDTARALPDAVEL